MKCEALELRPLLVCSDLSLHITDSWLFHSQQNLLTVEQFVEFRQPLVQNYTIQNLHHHMY